MEGVDFEDVNDPSSARKKVRFLTVPGEDSEGSATLRLYGRGIRCTVAWRSIAHITSKE